MEIPDGFNMLQALSTKPKDMYSINYNEVVVC